MDKVWLATRYYVDPKLDGISATTERMFTRLLAYAGLTETRGKLPTKPWVFVGLPNGKRSVFDLVDRGILTQNDDGTFEFPAWESWQKRGDDLAERKKNDRDRQRRRREAQRTATETVSRDMSRDVTLPEKRREENSTYVPSNPPVSDARTNDDATRVDDVADRQTALELVPQALPPMPRRNRQQALAALNATARSQTADRIATAFADSLDGSLDRQTLVEIGQVCDQLIRDHVPIEQIAAGIRAWHDSDSWSPTQIRRFVAKAARAAPQSKTTARITDARALADDLIREMHL